MDKQIVVYPYLDYACDVKDISRVWLFVTPWTVQSMEFSRPEYLSA